MKADTAAARLSGWQQCWRLLSATLIGVIVWLVTHAGLPADTNPTVLAWMRIGDPILAVGCLVLVSWRRRNPIAIAVIVIALSTVSAFAAGASLLALCSLATRRRFRETIPVGVFAVLTGMATSLLYPSSQGRESLWYGLGLIAVSMSGLIAFGFAIGARRELVRSLQERAETAEYAQHARAAEARIMERHRIAREMHDVLAHRISVVAMYAGVLGFRADLTPQEVTATAKAIADNSHEALEELRDILGVLRAQEMIASGSTTPEPPQPTLAALPALIAEARDSGLDITLTDTVTEDVPMASARTAYRIVQEGLTNVRKHAPGERVRVTLSGTAGIELTVTVLNTGIDGATTTFPHSGFGLLGLTERTELIGGTLQYGATPDGGFRLYAQLPWTTAREELPHTG
ncbi:sensor histidine kinase [Nocardia sp. CA-151230]|uniref:sensor histidine kinase n=1 Tax=Nocardia sp. CA-151230 TaxID=3239982 RepID=UPI003D9078F5